MVITIYVVYLEYRNKQITQIMKNLFYIRNTKTDESFDTNEMKFFSNSWTPEYEEDKSYLKGLISGDPEKFENCVVETVEIED